MRGPDIALVLGGGKRKGKSHESGDYEAAMDDIEGSGVAIKDRKLFREGLKAFIVECLAEQDEDEGSYHEDDDEEE